MRPTIPLIFCLVALSCSSVPEALDVALTRPPASCDPVANIRAVDARTDRPLAVVGGRTNRDGTLEDEVRLAGFESITELVEALAREVFCEAQASSSGLRPLPAPGDVIVLVVEELALLDDGHSLEFRARIGIEGTAPPAWLTRTEILVRRHVSVLRSGTWAAAFADGLDQWVDFLRERWSPGTRGRSLVDVRVRP